ncbi:MAG TPA: MFS transporter [Fervidobacterium sp.]|nr:MFS transporter [Fervidobacterium sp.]
MMATLLLTVIYLAFISLGLPDSLLGSAWPVMRKDLGVPLSAAGIISMTISFGTILSSLLSGVMIKKLGTAKVTFISCLMTAAALLGFSFSNSMIWLFLLAIPLGLGGGSVDSALNHYVAENYKAHHMNWLHSFWGVGATAGPAILSYYIGNGSSWRLGYRTVSIIQFTVAAILFASLPLWKRVEESRKASIAHSGPSSASKSHQSQAKNRRNGRGGVFGIGGVTQSLLAFLFYCGAEATVGLWGASYLVGTKSLSAQVAAGWVSLYYGGITVGRIISGFITMKVSNRFLILWGQLISLIGVLILLLPLPAIFYMVGLILIGLGFAPIFPGLIHETPARFGSENSAKLIGYQMATAYAGTTLLPPLFGLIAARTTVALFPLFALSYVVLMLLCTETVNHILRKQSAV